MDKIILIKYEKIILKGLNRPIFEDRLIKNLRLAAGGDASKIWKAQATIYIEPAPGVDGYALARRLSKVFGVVSATVATVTARIWGKFALRAKKLMSLAQGKTFKVEAKRADKRFPYKSPKYAVWRGRRSLRGIPLKVDVTGPTHCHV
jgi:thiamine biosynthesis protein ThiI